MAKRQDAKRDWREGRRVAEVVIESTFGVRCTLIYVGESGFYLLPAVVRM